MTDLNATKTPGYGFVASEFHIADESQKSFLYPYHSPQIASELITIAHALVTPRGRGIYATDETPDGIEARLDAASKETGLETGKLTEVEQTERRKNWRRCLYEGLPKGMCCHILFCNFSTFCLSMALYAPFITGILFGLSIVGRNFLISIDSTD